MTSDPGVTRQDSDYASQIQEALDELQHMQEAPRVVTTPEDLDTLEREIRGRTNRLWLFRCGVSPRFYVGLRGIPHEIS